MRTRLGRASRDRRSTPRGSCGRRGRCRALPQPCPGDAHEEVLAGKKGGAGAGVIHAAAAGLAGGAGGRDGETPLPLALWPAAPGVPQGRSPACGRERGLRGWRRQQAGLRSVAGRVTRGPAAQSHPAARAALPRRLLPRRSREHPAVCPRQLRAPGLHHRLPFAALRYPREFCWMRQFYFLKVPLAVCALTPSLLHVISQSALFLPPSTRARR